TVNVLQLSRLGVFLPEHIYYNAKNMRIAHFFAAYFLYFQFVSHMSMAINRYTIMLHPT
ncbi:hypothetical protein AAVH_41388, partial [Aphelenchoides avenae]